MKNIDFILSLIKDKNNKEELVNYIQTSNINIGDMDLEDIVLCILNGPWFLIFTEKLLLRFNIKNYRCYRK